ARHRVYLTKLAAALVFCAGLTVLLLLLGTVAAVALPHPAGPALTTVDTNRSIVALDPGGWLLRVAAAGGYLMLWLSALAAIGVLAGLLTRSAVGGVGLAIGYHLVATVLTQLTSLRAIHPALLPYWLGRWTTVAQTHPHWASLAEGAACAGGYLVAATLIGLVRLRRQDVTA
ncbi:MAG: hypothetical protein J2P15_19330, partial [Micromonosporaceae bacterium]|nr:hypothetical protein [Micromonosporaceae bacterium]